MPLAALAAVGIAGSVAGGLIAKSGADAQAKAVENATNQSVAEQRRQYDQNRADLAPYRQAGYSSLAELQRLEGTAGDPTSAGYGSLLHNFSNSDFVKDPGYDFRLAEGAKALERSAAARGMTASGAQLKALTEYNQNFASNEFQNAYNRYNQNRQFTYNSLAGPAGLGLQATDTGVNAGTATSANISNTIMTGATGAANARASGYAGLANGITGGIQNGINGYLFGRMLNNYPGGSSYPGTPPIVQPSSGGHVPLL